MTRDLEVGQEVVELSNEELDRPELGRLPLQVAGLTAADLVIEYNWDPTICSETRVGKDIVVGNAWTAVEHDEGRFAGGEVTEDFVPCLEGLALVDKVDLASGYSGGGHGRLGWALNTLYRAEVA